MTEEQIIKKNEKVLSDNKVQVSFITEISGKKIIELNCYSIDSKFIIKEGRIFKGDIFSVFAVYDPSQCDIDKCLGYSATTLQVFIYELTSAIDNHKKFNRYY